MKPLVPVRFIVLAWWWPFYPLIAAIVLLTFAGQCFLTGLLYEFALGKNPPEAPYAISETTP